MTDNEKGEYDKYDDPFYIPNNDVPVNLKKLAKKWGAKLTKKFRNNNKQERGLICLEMKQ